jgi:hypothetical protein
MHRKLPPGIENAQWHGPTLPRPDGARHIHVYKDRGERFAPVSGPCLEMPGFASIH